MYGNEVSLTQSAIVTVFSICLVFLALFLISELITVMARLINRKKETPDFKPAAEKVETPEEAPLPLAVITAAVACMGGADKLVIRKIAVAKPSESTWTQAARLRAVK